MFVQHHIRWPGFLSALFMLAVAAAPARAEIDTTRFTLIAHSGRYPSSVAFDDSARSLVGIVYPADGSRLTGEIKAGEYATAFLVSPCYAMTSAAAIAALEHGMSLKHAIAHDDRPWMFSLSNRSVEARGASEKHMWPAVVVPAGASYAGTSEGAAWSLLRLEDCEPAEAMVDASGLDDDLVMAWDRADEAIHRTRQLGILPVDGLAANSHASAFSMLGGPFQVFDAGRQRWITIGLAVAPNQDRAGYPASSRTNAHSPVTPGIDDGVSSFFSFEPQIFPLSAIWPSIEQAIQLDMMHRERQPQADPTGENLSGASPRS